LPIVADLRLSGRTAISAAAGGICIRTSEAYEEQHAVFHDFEFAAGVGGIDAEGE